jgi:hypothetical protein
MILFESLLLSKSVDICMVLVYLVVYRVGVNCLEERCLRAETYLPRFSFYRLINF